jgi:hypothetical protein
MLTLDVTAPELPIGPGDETLVLQGAPQLVGLGASESDGLPWYWKYNPWRPVYDLVAPLPPDPMSYKDDPQGYLAAMTRYARQVDVVAIPTAIHTFLLRPIGAALGAMHGYKRNHGDAAQATLWGVLGFLFPVIAPTTAIIQGYGKPKNK